MDWRTLGRPETWPEVTIEMRPKTTLGPHFGPHRAQVPLRDPSVSGPSRAPQLHRSRDRSTRAHLHTP